MRAAAWTVFTLAAVCAVCEGDAALLVPPLAVMRQGCAEEPVPNVCEVSEDRTLVLWVSGPSKQAPRVEVDGRRIAAAPEAVLGGQRVMLKIPEAARRLELTRAGARFSLQLREHARYSVLEGIAHKRDEGRLDDAQDALQGLFASADRRLAAKALNMAARIEMQRGAFAKAIALFQRAIAAARESGQRRLAATAYLATAYIYEADLFAPARALEALDLVDEQLDVEQAWTLYHRGHIAFLRGDARAALRFIDEGGRAATRLGHPLMQLTLGGLELMQLAELGRLEECREKGEALARLVDHPCDRGDLHTNLAWAELSAKAGDMRRAMEQAQKAVSIHEGSCPDVPRLQNALINTALVHFRRADFKQAKACLERAVAMNEAQGWVKAWVLELDARIALSGGHARRALSLYEQLRERAASAATVSSAWRAELGRGRALRALNEPERAVEAFERAEEGLDEDARRVPLSEGRDVFTGDRDESARELVDVLISLGRPKDALLAARRARARALRVFRWRSQLARLPATERQRLEAGLADYREARERILRAEDDAWALPLSGVAEHLNKQQGAIKQAHAYLDQALAVLGASSRFVPRPVQEGELLLAYHPLPRGWAAFAQSTSGVSAVRIDALAPHDAPSALAAQLLAPFAAQIAQAERLRLIPYGVLKDVDFHALPVGDGLLIDAVPVAYGGDLGQEESQSKSPAERRFLVVADPLNDLKGARAEGQCLRDAWQDRFPTRVLVGEEASYDRVVAELQRADVFHFAGHAEFEQSGWQSGMRLAANTMLEPGDIVALSSVPSLVILSGCETTRERMDVPVASIGLAQAFLARGAQNVIATTRPVADDIGFALSRALAQEDLARLDATSFRRVLQKVREVDGSGRDWRSYRLLVP